METKGGICDYLAGTWVLCKRSTFEYSLSLVVWACTWWINVQAAQLLFSIPAWVIHRHLSNPCNYSSNLLLVSLQHEEEIRIILSLERTGDDEQAGQKCPLESLALLLSFLALLKSKRCWVSRAGVSAAAGLCIGFSPRCLLHEYHADAEVDESANITVRRNCFWQIWKS